MLTDVGPIQIVLFDGVDLSLRDPLCWAPIPRIRSGKGFKSDWIRGMSKLFTLYTVATGTPSMMEISMMVTFVTLHLSGLPGSHHCMPRETPISTLCLRLDFSRCLIMPKTRLWPGALDSSIQVVMTRRCSGVRPNPMCLHLPTPLYRGSVDRWVPFG